MASVGAAAMPALLAGLGGAAALMGTAGIAAVGFGALASTSISGVIEKTSELEKLQEKVDNASNAKERSKALAEQKTYLASLTAEERNAVTATQDFKANWSDMQDEMSPTTFTMMANGMDLTNNVMTKMFPAMKGVGDSFAGMLGQMNSAIEGGKADAFFEHINTFAAPMFEMAMQSVGNVLKGLGNIMMAFTPLGMDMGNGMVDLTAKFADWSAGLQSSQGFRQFVDFVKTSVPVIMNIFSQLFGVLVKLGTALAPLGLVILQLASDFLTWANNSGAVQTALDAVSNAGTWMSQNMDTVKTVIASVVAGFVALKTALGVASAIKAVSEGFTLLNNTFKLATVGTNLLKGAQALLNTTMWASPVTWVIAGIVALIAIGVLLWRNWDTVKAKAQELWNKMVDMWEGIKQSWNDGVEAVKQYFTNLWSDTVQTATSMYNDVINWFSNLWNSAKSTWNNGVEQVKTFFLNLAIDIVQKAMQMRADVIQWFTDLWNSAKDTWNSGVQAVKNFFTNLYNDAKTIAGNIKQGIVDKFNELWNSAKSTWDSSISSIKQIFSNSVSTFKSTVKDIANGIIDGFKDGFTKAKNAVTDGVKNCWSAIKDYASDFLSAGKGLLEAFTDGVKNGISGAISAVSDGMASIRSYLPFSPAKKGPLSDLDKSGKAFFPTWYESALTQVKPMTKAIGGAMGAVADEIDGSIGGETLRAFTGGRNSITIRHEHSVTGEVGIDGKGVSDLARTVKSEVIASSVSTSSGAGFMNDLRQELRRR